MSGGKNRARAAYNMAMKAAKDKSKLDFNNRVKKSQETNSKIVGHRTSLYDPFVGNLAYSKSGEVVGGDHLAKPQYQRPHKGKWYTHGIIGTVVKSVVGGLSTLYGGPIAGLVGLTGASKFINDHDDGDRGPATIKSVIKSPKLAEQEQTQAVRSQVASTTPTPIVKPTTNSPKLASDEEDEETKNKSKQLTILG